MGNICSYPRASGDERGNKKRKKKTPSFDTSNCQAVASKCRFTFNNARKRSQQYCTRVLNNRDGNDVRRRYEFGRELGRGEFGVTHLCVDVRTGEELACKSISKGKLRTEVDVEDVRREVEIMRSLPESGNIVRLREVYEDREAVHLVIELCKGGELFDRIVARGHYTERAAADIVRAIVEIVVVVDFTGECSASSSSSSSPLFALSPWDFKYLTLGPLLPLCRKHGVMHRDLKPENFLFADESESAPLKAIDFGLSVFFKPGEQFTEIVGSPYYMAPEVLKRNYGPEVDIWSAGVILYILLCGFPPFWAETEEGVSQAIIKSVIDFQREPWPMVSDSAKDLVKRMLEPNPKLRMTAQEVLDHPWLKNIETTPNIPLGETVRARLKQFSVMNKFKKRALKVVAESLPLEQVAGIKQMFHMMDTNNNGNLSFEELKVGFHKMGQSVPDPDVQMLMDAADVDGNGSLDYGEFVTVSLHLKRINSEEHLNSAFTYFDKNQSGYIEIEELRDALAEHCLDPNAEDVIRDIILDVDTDKDGRISYDEFLAMMKCGTDWRKVSRQFSRDLFNNLSIKLMKNGTLPEDGFRLSNGGKLNSNKVVLHTELPSC